MPLYRYKAMDRSGNVAQGSSHATNLQALTEILQGQGLFLIESREEQAEVQPAPAPPPKRAARPAPVPEKPQAEPGPANPKATAPLDDVAVFTSQLSIMVRTGLPIMEALNSLARQQTHAGFKAALSEIARSVQHGQPLSQAFGRYPRIFDEFYISLLSSGEASGKMPLMLDRMSAHLEFKREMRSKIQSALVYPCIVVCTALAVVAFLVLFILPTFMEVFQQFNLELPLPTRILIGFSDHVRSWWLAYLAGAVVAEEFVRRRVLNPAHRRELHVMAVELPILGPVVRAIVMSRTFRTMAALVSSGVPILKSIELSKAAAGNAAYEDVLSEMHRDATEGKGLSRALASSPYIPEQVANMVANAERTGSLPEVLTSVSDHFEREADTALKNLFTAIEPLFVVFLAVLVGGIAVSVLMPIFNLSSTIQVQ